MGDLSNYPELLAGVGFWIIILCVVVFLFIFWLFNVICMMLGAKAAGIQDRSFVKAFLASLLISWLGGLLIGFLSFLHPFVGVVGLLFVPAVFIKIVYACGLGKALVAYIVNITVSFVLMIALFVVLIFGFGFSVDKLKGGDGGENAPVVEEGR